MSHGFKINKYLILFISYHSLLGCHLTSFLSNLTIKFKCHLKKLMTSSSSMLGDKRKVYIIGIRVSKSVLQMSNAVTINYILFLSKHNGAYLYKCIY